MRLEISTPIPRLRRRGLASIAGGLRQHLYDRGRFVGGLEYLLRLPKTRSFHAKNFDDALSAQNSAARGQLNFPNVVKLQLLLGECSLRNTRCMGGER